MAEPLLGRDVGEQPADDRADEREVGAAERPGREPGDGDREVEGDGERNTTHKSGIGRCAAEP